MPAPPPGSAPAPHPLWPAGGPPGWPADRPAPPPPAGAACGGCAWAYEGGRGPAVWRCRFHRGARIGGPGAPACPAFAPSLDCAPCGACCREAFDVVELGPRDPFVRAHPGRVVWEAGRPTLPRGPDGRCPCLVPRPGGTGCAVYAERPRTCRDFTLGSANCAEARRRVGAR